MIELAEGTLEPLDEDGGPRPASVVDLGSTSPTAEMVDSKCFLGVMNPSTLMVHRACAVRCVSGGIPPLLVVRDGAGRTVPPLLVGSDGGSVNDELLGMIAEPAHITGHVERHDDLLVLRADPDPSWRVRTRRP